MATIKKIHAREILDSRGNPTIEVEVHTDQNIMGKADAEATEIYALSYGRSPEFYNYFKTLETYKNTLDSSTFFILSTDNKYFKFLEQ